MSTELALFRDKNAVIPAHRIPGGDELTKSLMGAESIGKRISIKGSVFRMIVGGEEIDKIEERSLDVVIVAAAPKTSRTFYEGNYQEGVAALPDCWSNDGLKPDPKSNSPQASSCANCPQNLAGSGQGSSRACRYSRRLAVVLANNIDGSDIFQVVLPAQSIFGKAENNKMPLEAYARFIHGHGLTVNSVVTEMRFDTSSATPKLTFRAVRPLDENEVSVVVDKGSSQEAISAITFNPAQQDNLKPKAELAAPEERPSAKKTEVFREPAAKATPKATPAPEPQEEEEASAPTVRASKKPAAQEDDLDDLLNAWGSDDE